MRVLVTGHDGYLGRPIVDALVRSGHEVAGLDNLMFRTTAFPAVAPSIPMRTVDIRDTTPEMFEGFEAVVHLAGIANDPLGDLNPVATVDINRTATRHMATMAKQAGVERFVFSSSCSLYGAHGDEFIHEESEFRPVTPYGESKMYAEEDLRELADDDFHPTYLRNGTVYGFSPVLRGDLVVNNLTGHAFATGKVFLKSDGRVWRPLIHVEDIARAFRLVTEAPLEVIHDEAFNVCSTTENYLIRDVATIVGDVVPDCELAMADGATTDARNYRVSGDKLAQAIPAFKTRWNVKRGVEELLESYRRYGLTIGDLEGPRFRRRKTVEELQSKGLVDGALRMATESAAAVA